MRALKVLVVVMGVLIVVGVAVLAATILGRVNQRQAAVTPAAAVVATRAAPFGQATVPLPVGAKVVEMQAVGTRLVLRLERADGKQELLVLDPDFGTVLGTIELRAGD